MRKFIAAIFITVFLAVGLGAFAFFKFINVPVNSEKVAKVFDVQPGESFFAVSKNLFNQGIVANQRFFYWYGRLMGYPERIQIGEYELFTNQTPREILDILVTGKSIIYPITVPEGFNSFEIAALLEARWPGRSAEFLRLISTPELISKLIGEKRSSLEGYLFPDTYNITKYTPMKLLVETMVQRFQEEFKLAAESARLNMPRHDVVILASVIEKETGAPEERPLISSVFHNRLKLKMRLQSDPTIIYGKWVATGAELKNIRRADIEEKTPYNTYAINGLPAGPIANPGREALRAAMNPVESEYLYFVSKNDGTHVFTKEYKDHAREVQKLQINKKAREGKSWRDLKKNKK